MLETPPRPSIVFLVLLAAVQPSIADDISDRRRELNKLQEKISRKERERRQADARARELEEEVGRISGELRSSRRALKEVEGRLRDTEKRRADAEDRLWASRLDVKQWNRTLSSDLRRIYERRAAAEAGRFIELAWRRRLAAQKAAAMSAAVERHAEIRAGHEELVELKTEYESLRSQRETEAERVREAKKDMTGVLATVQGRKAVLENEIGELNASAKRFEALIQKLILEEERRAAAARAQAEKQASAKRPRKAAKAAAALPDFGRMPWPVDGAVVERFGKFKHPELDTVVVSNGIKIRPAQAGPVRVVAAGDVLYAGEFLGYGLMALVSHPDNLFTIYAHLGELKAKKGRKVSVGEILGRTGADGEDRPVLYFELRLHGEAMDPLLWLK